MSGSGSIDGRPPRAWHGAIASWTKPRSGTSSIRRSMRPTATRSSSRTSRDTAPPARRAVPSSPDPPRRPGEVNHDDPCRPGRTGGSSTDPTSRDPPSPASGLRWSLSLASLGRRLCGDGGALSPRRSPVHRSAGHAPPPVGALRCRRRAAGGARRLGGHDVRGRSERGEAAAGGDRHPVGQGDALVGVAGRHDRAEAPRRAPPDAVERARAVAEVEARGRLVHHHRPAPPAPARKRSPRAGAGRPRRARTPSPPGGRSPPPPARRAPPPRRAATGGGTQTRGAPHRRHACAR